jgi:GNAT superfamily N-acetyltransferase
MDTDYKIVPSTEDESEAVHEMLRAYNRKFMREFGDYSFHIEDAGKIVAGIVAGSVFDTLEVEFLFVDENYRGKGLGRALIDHVEERAARDGLRRILLNTYSFQAPDFYRALGYEQLLKIEPCFGEYSQYFFMKRL